ncbi:MAG: MFS transporter [Clostridia bacterium]|nr:MFS transporter [Clostridia bacterium]
MEATAPDSAPFRLNYKRTFIIGLAFFGILLMWQVYDSYVSSFLSELFKKTFSKSDPEEVQYLVGIMMALDNIAAIVLMPLFGKISDRTRTKIGKRMPFILIGTFVCALVFPFIPVAFHHSNLGALIVLVAMTVLFAMMYRSPAVALMPDLTPKPLRSRANGIINICGYIGGAVPTILGMFLVLSNYLGTTNPDSSQFGNLWVIEIPFLLASVLMVVTALVLFFSIRENKIKESIKDEMERGEKYSEVDDVAADPDARLSKRSRISLMIILAAEFFWFMADNGISTFMTNYTLYHLQASTGSNSLNTMLSGLCSVVGFALAGLIVSRIGRKWTVITGLGLTLGSYAAWFILSLLVAPSGTFPAYLFVLFGLKGFGMALVHVNSFPMVVEFCPGTKVGQFTGYYYVSSMVAQSVTPIALGALMLTPGFGFGQLPLYALCCIAVSFTAFFFVRGVTVKKTPVKVGLEALGEDSE